MRDAPTPPPPPGTLPHPGNRRRPPVSPPRTASSHPFQASRRHTASPRPTASSHPFPASLRHTANHPHTSRPRQAYGQAPPYGDPTTYGPGPYAAPGTYGAPQRNGSALALTITAGILSVLCCSVLTVPALILGIVGLSKQSTDPEGAARMTRYGWIAFGVGVLVSILALTVFFALGAGGYFDDSGPYDGF